MGAKREATQSCTAKLFSLFQYNAVDPGSPGGGGEYEVQVSDSCCWWCSVYRVMVLGSDSGE